MEADYANLTVKQERMADKDVSSRSRRLHHAQLDTCVIDAGGLHISIHTSTAVLPLCETHVIVADNGREQSVRQVGEPGMRRQAFRGLTIIDVVGEFVSLNKLVRLACRIRSAAYKENYLNIGLRNMSHSFYAAGTIKAR